MSGRVPRLREEASGGDTLVLTVDLPRLPPPAALELFLDPDLLTAWWPGEARVERTEGGAYELRWPAQDWTLEGRVLSLDAGRRFAFRWRWAHEPDQPDRVVEVRAEAAGPGGTDAAAALPPGAGTAGTRLTLRHGPYGPGDAEAEQRRSHREGWLFFGDRLRALADRATWDAGAGRLRAGRPDTPGEGG